MALLYNDWNHSFTMIFFSRSIILNTFLLFFISALFFQVKTVDLLIKENIDYNLLPPPRKSTNDLLVENISEKIELYCSLAISLYEDNEPDYIMVRGYIDKVLDFKNYASDDYRDCYGSMALYLLATMNQNGKGTFDGQPDYRAARRNYEAIIEIQNVDLSLQAMACYEVALMIYNKKGLSNYEKKVGCYKKVRNYFTQALQNKNLEIELNAEETANAHYYLGLMDLKGRGLPVFKRTKKRITKKNALDHFETALKNKGLSPELSSQLHAKLCEMKLEGDGLKQPDYASAMNHFNNVSKYDNLPENWVKNIEIKLKIIGQNMTFLPKKRKSKTLYKGLYDYEFDQSNQKEESSHHSSDGDKSTLSLEESNEDTSKSSLLSSGHETGGVSDANDFGLLFNELNEPSSDLYDLDMMLNELEALFQKKVRS